MFREYGEEPGWRERKYGSRALHGGPVAQSDAVHAPLIRFDPLNFRGATDGSAMFTDERGGGIDIQIAQSHGGDHHGRVPAPFQERLPERLDEDRGGGFIAVFIHDRDGKRFPERSPRFFGLARCLQPLRDRRVSQGAFGSAARGHPTAQNPQAIGDGEQSAGKNPAGKVERRGKRHDPQRPESPAGMVEQQRRILLRLEQMTRADSFEEVQGVLACGDEHVLAIVHRVTRDRIFERIRPAAKEGFLFEDGHGDAARGKVHCRGETADPAPHYRNRVHSACRATPAESHERLNHEYLSRWLSQYRKVIRSLRSLEMEIRRSNTL